MNSLLYQSARTFCAGLRYMVIHVLIRVVRLAILRCALSLVLAFLGILGILSLLFPLHVDIPFSTLIAARDSTIIHAFLASDDKWRMKTDIAELSPLLRTALIAKEDRWFYWHCGVNPVALVRATIQNITAQRTVSGASTLTMQVARMLEQQYASRYGNPHQRPRTLWNKLVEIFRALQLECVYSKDEIIQLYTNLAPYGGNIEGVKAASMLYFGRLPDKISLAQAVTLAIIPNRPTTLKLAEHNTAIQRERDKWLERFRSERIFPDSLINDALREPLGVERRQAPSTTVPHLAYRMKRSFPTESIIYTTIDTRKQHAVQTLTQNVIRRLTIYGIRNAAVLVVNNQRSEVEAYLGSPNYDDKAASGEVDGVRAVRSPGSALKPLIYALAMDRGLITPKTIMTDAPSNFDGYAPENFDRQYRGFISAEKALINSLNIPAVKLLQQLGVAAVSDVLIRAGFEQIRKDAAKLGLSLVLGGCGVRLEEMAALYSAFARYGEWRPLHMYRTTPPQPTFGLQVFRTRDSMSSVPNRLISPSAAFMLGEILTQLTRPDVPRNFASTRRLPKVAWKTGTSYGRRDAWSIGYNKRYTVAVWVGNFSGQGVPELVGADIATPLLFDIFNAIDYDSPNDWFEPPPEIDFRLVCSESGLLPAEHCTNQVTDYYIPGVSSNARCSHQKSVIVSADEQVSYCPDCLPSTGYKKKLYPNLPPEIVALYSAENRAFERIPPHNPACTRAQQSGTAPTITSLIDGKQYYVEHNTRATTVSKLMLSCHAANDVRTVYWYVNDKFLCSVPPEERVFFTPEHGYNKISCSDDKGRTSSITILVEWQ
ncbi:MAG: penicillin-binding protein 1C [Bacteroidota bacterium]|nr:penicillin-binding protein 1C [Candidatus Kapabacteria bacterium]MDW8219720.1 penicillin-binding protein 1C [Bacteroidota bacterium]